MHRLTASERDAFLRSAPAWRLLPDRDAIRRDDRFLDFDAAWAFMARVATIAQRMDHHPEWSNTFDRVTIVLTTHDAGGLTGRDVTMAAAIDAAFVGSSGIVVDDIEAAP